MVPRYSRHPLLLAAVLLLVSGMLLSAIVLQPRAARAADTYTFTVDNVGDSGAGSLRQAILDANAQLPEDEKIINFNIPTGPYEILLSSDLPPLLSGNTTIDGYSQAGASEGPIGSRTIVIALNGQGSIGGGLTMGSAGNTVRGLAVYGFTSNGIGIAGAGASGNVVSGNYLGTYADGSSTPSSGAADNVNISNSATGNTIGGSAPGDGNLISAALHEGVCIRAEGNFVTGNYIGTDRTGAAALPNESDGVWIDGSAASSSNNIIGGSNPGEGNIISGNANGISISGDNAEGNAVAGNAIGLNADSTAGLPNGAYGVSITSGAGSASNPNTVGGEGGAAGNVIAYNGDSGVYVSEGGSENNEILGNQIGHNGRFGVNLDGAPGCIVRDNTITDNGSGQPSYEASNSPRALGGNDYDQTIFGFQGCFFIGNPGSGEFSPVPADGSMVQFADGVRDFNVGLVHSWNASDDLYMTWYVDAGIFTSKEVLQGFMEMIMPGFGYDNSEIQDGGFELAFQATSPGNDYTPVGSLPVVTGYSPPTLDYGTTISDSGVNLNSTNCAVTDNVIEENLGSGVSFATFGDSIDNQVTGNRIRNNQTTGVVVWSLGSYRNRISRNSTYGNGGLGIDLLGDGVTPNDGNNDNPDKPNRGYNFPVFSGEYVLVDESGDAPVNGTAPPNATVELYNTGASQDPSGHGEGYEYLTTTAADASGDFSATVSGVSAGDRISAIAISPPGDPSGEGNTSEFSANVEVQNPKWYLTEGSSDWGFDTYVTIMNPNTTAVRARVTYLTASGPVTRPDIVLPASSQTVINPRDDIGSVDFSTIVESMEGRTIAVDRRVSWTGQGAPSPEGHSSIGVMSPDRTWYLPEGSSAWGFECWLLVLNPNAAEAACTVTYMMEDGAPVTVQHKVPAMSRASLNIADDIGAADASIRVDSTLPVTAERSMYRNNRREGHCSVGADEPANDFYLAEGSSAWGFTTYVLVQNPNAGEAQVTVTYMTPDGPIAEEPFTMAARSRRTIRASDAVPYKTDFSTLVHGSSPIVVERVMQWGEGTALGEASHCSIGMDSTHSTFYLPDGETTNNHDTWTVVQNPNNTEVEIELSYMTLTGQGNKVISDTVAANSRRTYRMSQTIPAGRAAVKVTCKTAGRKIMAEQAMYWNDMGAGTATIGSYSD